MPPGRGVLEKAREFLRAELGDGPKLREPLLRAAQAAGYNEKNVEMASRQLGIISDRVKVDGLGWRARWQLPGPGAPEPAPAWPIPAPPDPTRPAAVTDAELPNLGASLEQLQQLRSMVDVYRYVDGEPAYLDSLPGNEISLRTIKRRYGGGRYALPSAGVTFVIEGAPLSAEGADTQPRARGRLEGTNRPEPAVAGGDVMQLMLAMVKQQGDLIIALLTKGSASDPVSMFKAVDDAVARRLEGAGPQQPAQQALELIREGMKLGRDTAGEGDGDDDSFVRVIDKVSPFINALAKRIGPTEAPSAAPALPAAPDAPPSPTIPLTYLQRVLADLAPILPDLCSHAKKATDVNQIASFILQEATDEQYESLAGAADSPQFVTELMGELAKRLQHHGYALPWLRKVAERLNELLAEDRTDRGGRTDANGADAH